MLDYVLGIDPGFTGALALYDVRNHIVDIEDMPTTGAQRGKKRTLDLPGLLRAIDRMATFADACVVEQVATMPRQGIASAGRFMYVAGAIDGVLAGQGKPLVKWTPQVWKMRAGLPRSEDRAARKTASRERAAIIFPAQADAFARVKDDGRAEAALLAWAYAQWHQSVAAG